MAERHDNQGGRMLFTDFDVSGKGRPVPALSHSDMQAFMRSSLPTIAEIASSLELDFEEDGDAPDSPEPKRRGAGEGRREPPGAENRESAPESDDIWSDFADEPFTASPPAGPPPTVTWEDFTRAFHSAPPARASAAGAGVFDDFPDAGAPPAADGGSEIDDVLSFLASFPMDPRSGEAAGHGEYPGSRLGVSPPPPRPYGGVERVDDWYNPPENTPAPPPTDTDWFEPPEPSGGGVGDYAARPTRRFERPGDGEDKASVADTQRMDMFSDVDLDALWDDKLKRGKEAGTKHPAGDTAFLDMFDTADLDSAWEEKRRDAAARAGARTKAESGLVNGDTTLILSADGLFKDRAPGGGSKRGTDAAVAAKEGGVAEKESDADLLKELDATVKEAPLPVPATPSAKVSRGVSLGDIIFEDDSEVVDGDASVSAPNVGDADLLDVRALAGKNRDETSAEPPPRAAARKAAVRGTAPAPAPDTPGEAATHGVAGAFDDAADVHDTADIDADSAPSLPAADAEQPGGEGEETPSVKRKRGLTTDDLLSDLDLDDVAGIDHNVSPPVIDDSAIDQLRKPKRGTEEMAAIVEKAGTVADGDETAEEPAAVAVNPADVFANMDDMDFSDDGLDDEMQAMLDEDEQADEAAAAEPPPATRVRPAAAGNSKGGRALSLAGAVLRRLIPGRFLEKLEQLIAWRENWWFYCDLLAAIIASGSLAVIISYYVWYRK